MNWLLKLLCGSTEQGSAHGPRLSRRPLDSAPEQPIYTHLTTLFEDDIGLYSFITKFQHNRRHPEVSLRNFLVPAQNVVSYKQVHLLYHNLPSTYEIDTKQRKSSYDHQKPIYAHLTTVFLEEQPLFSFFLEFQKAKHSPVGMEDRFPRPDQIIYAEKMNPVCRTLQGCRIVYRSNSMHLGSVRRRPRAQSATASERGPANPASAISRNDSPRDSSSQLPKRRRSETCRPTRYAPRSRSMSAAAATSALYGSDKSRPRRKPSKVEEPPVESVSYLTGTARPRGNPQSTHVAKHDGISKRNSVRTSIRETITYATTRADAQPEETRNPGRTTEQPWGRRTTVTFAKDEGWRDAEEAAFSRPTISVVPESRKDQPVAEPIQNGMSPTAELLYNPFAESYPRPPRTRGSASPGGRAPRS